MKSYRRAADGLILLLLTVGAILLQGYHPGAEDDGVYLAAIKQDLKPQLYPRDAAFFKVQLQATIFDKLVAASVRLTHLPIAWAEFLWQFACIFLILWGCLRLARTCFNEAYARWAGVALVAALLTLPVTGTGLYLVDEHMHPRTLATALILAALVAVTERKWLLAGALLLGTVMIHPIMACFGISCCGILCFAQREPARRPAAVMVAAVPLGWIFEPVSPAWRQAANSRSIYFLSRWTWYEWLGVFAPMLLLWWFSRIGERARSEHLEQISRSAVIFGVIQLAVACAMTLPQSFMRLLPLQPMRYLQLVYLLLALLGGCLLGQTVLRRHVYRWLLLFVPLCGGMLYAQRQVYRGVEHLELPGRRSVNPWLQAFDWIRINTPENAYFAIDPHYLEMPTEDFHGFRALAERSVLADAVKDTSVVTQVPTLAARWQKENEAQAGWPAFQTADFERLQRDFGVTWFVVGSGSKADLACPYSNAVVKVCQLPRQQ